jgi:hypothetical protein
LEVSVPGWLLPVSAGDALFWLHRGHIEPELGLGSSVT